MSSPSACMRALACMRWLRKTPRPPLPTQSFLVLAAPACRWRHRSVCAVGTHPQGCDEPACGTGGPPCHAAPVGARLQQRLPLPHVRGGCRVAFKCLVGCWGGRESQGCCCDANIRHAGATATAACIGAYARCFSPRPMQVRKLLPAARGGCQLQRRRHPSGSVRRWRLQ